MDGSKRCPRCGQIKAAKEFYASKRGDGLSAYCVACHSEDVRARSQAVRQLALAKLGGTCVACGFADSDSRALQFDHVNGGGRQRAIGGESRYRLWRGVLDGSLTDLQVLCANDNHRKRIRQGEHCGVRVYEHATAGLDRQKRCPRCEQTKPGSQWSANAGRYDGLSVYCSACLRENGAAARAQRTAALQQMLGGLCVRCGESDPVVLCVDHVEGGGSQERRSLVAGSAAFVAKVLANPDEYRLLCCNCNWIVRDEQNQTVGDRTYSRTVPTERIEGPGKGSHPNTKAALRNWMASATPERLAAVAATRVSPEANAKRSASLERTWAGKTEEQRLVIRANQSEARRRSRQERVAAETTVHPSWAARGLERCADCGTRAKPHGTRGMCKACYMRSYMAGRVKA